MAHPKWVKQAHAIFMEQAQAKLAGYERLPLNAWQMVELINTVLTPQWTYRRLLIPRDVIYKQLDKLSKDFVTQCKRLEKGRHSTKLPTPVTKGGMGLYQQFWAFRKRYVIVM